MARRNWCVTFWEDPADRALDAPVQYACVGRELCPTTGRTHWQAYVEFSKPVRGSFVKSHFGQADCHFEARRGTQDEAIRYCKKDGLWAVYGTPGKQGARNDLREVADAIRGGKSISSIAEENPAIYCQYRNGLRDIGGFAIAESSKQFRQIQVSVYHGKAGCGKTRKAVEENPDAYILSAPDSGQIWWDGYEGQSCLILDDFYGGIKYSSLLRVLDGYQYRLAIKGSFTYAQWTKVIITSNDHPDTWYQMFNGKVSPALKRRINEIIEIVSICPLINRNRTKIRAERAREERSSSALGRSGAAHLLTLQ